MRGIINPGTLLIILAFIFAAPAFAVGKIIYVDDDATGANSGTSWVDAYKYLQDALADANSSTKPVEIRVAQGIYRPDETFADPNGSGDREATFQLINGVTLKGGYAGFRKPDPNARDIAIYHTILSGDIGRPEYKEDNCYHIFYHPKGLNLDTSAIIDGFTITGGNANGDWPHNCGGGMFNYYNSPTLTNCTFSNNLSSSYGGGMSNYSSNPTVINCTFNGNSTDRGGGMDNDYYSSPTVNNCTFTANSAEYYGGGMYNGYYSSPTVEGCTFSANRAYYGGAGMENNYDSNPTVEGCTFIANSAEVWGGGMDNFYHSRPNVNNCTFSGNSASDGGGMSNYYYCRPTLINCTIADNNAPNGAAMACDSYQPYPSTVIIVNSIIWNGSDWMWNNDNSTITITYSDLQGGWPGTGNINADPCFADPTNDDYHLQPDSPCIDTGDPNYVVEPNETDLDGNPRVMGGRLDMGAYEAALPEIEVPMKFTPQALNCNSKGKWIKAHFVLPAEFTVGDVDANSPAKLEPLGIESHHMDVFVNEEGLVQVDAAFDCAAFCDVAGCGSIEITVVGLLTDGRYFYGIDTIKIIKNSFECLAVLSSYWLQADCGKPGWCNGFDVDRDSIVNLKDFALMASHWLEDYSD